MSNKAFLKEYYKGRIKKTTNPKHIEYYKESIKALDMVSKTKIYSTVLKMSFASAYEASVYLGKSGAYVYQIMNGRVKNKYNFQYV